MNRVVYPLIISSLAGISTVIGGLVVYLNIKNKKKFISFALSFSLSVMISISILDLIPSSASKIFKTFNFYISMLIIIISFLVGIIIITKLNKKSTLLSTNNLYRVGVLSMISLMIHNFPEGIATFMSSYNNISSGISLGLAIMMHNIPEGISIAVPIYYATGSKKRGVIYSLISGVTEPFGAIIAYILLKNHINDLTISIVLIIVSGIMITLSIEELFPESIKYNNKRENIIGVILGILLVLINVILL